MLAQSLSEVLGQQVVVENKSGAAGNIASQVVAEARPDGYTLLIGTSIMSIVPAMYDKLPYDPLNSLIAVAHFTTIPMIIVVPAEGPKTIEELVALLRNEPGKHSYGSPGNGSLIHMGSLLFAQRAGGEALHVPYRGSAPAVTDVATGAVTMSFSSLAAALPLIQDGRLRAVAVTSRERMPQLPDVAPLAEAAPELKTYELLNWFGMFATAATPEPIVARLNDIVTTGLRDKAIAEKLEVQGIVPRIMSPAQYRDFVTSEAEKFGKIVAQANIKAEN
jgi:tripartite-type tricarboxylate transporter receptor subunit TctC